MPEPSATVLESVRRVVDPVQASLIAAHVTLIRENEISEHCWRNLIDDLQSPEYPLTLKFGEPERSIAHGILMPCQEGHAEFQRLRCRLFKHLADRETAAHLTLAHPRNPQAPGNTLENTRPLKAGITVSFQEMALIRQTGNAPWQILQTAPLCLREKS